MSTLQQKSPLIVGRIHHHTLMDAALPPAAYAEPGELVTFETQDACYGQVRSTADFERYRHNPNRQPDPLTGPVFINGARRGGGLKVDIVSVELEPEGFQLIGPHRAIIRDEIPDWDCYRVTVDAGMIDLGNRLRLPIDPVVGTLGVSPAAAPTNRPNRLGGNLDCPQIRVGVSVYLPVEVDGAFFYLGDVHARQGDGEVVGAPEIAARVTVQFALLDEPVGEWPIVEDASSWHVVAAAATEEDAIRLATFELARFITRCSRLSLNDALVLLTMCITLRCSRTGGHGDLERVICASIAKETLDLIATGPCGGSRS